jgi:hypothetical protein
MTGRASTPGRSGISATEAERTIHSVPTCLSVERFVKDLEGHRSPEV